VWGWSKFWTTDRSDSGRRVLPRAPISNRLLPPRQSAHGMASSSSTPSSPAVGSASAIRSDASKPATPSKKKVSLALTDSPPGTPSSPTADDLNFSHLSPHSAAKKQHEYTSLSALRKANKGKAVDRGDRKNGWHLWSVEGDGDGGGGQLANGSSGGGQNKEEQQKAVKNKLSTFDMVRLIHRVCLLLEIMEREGGVGLVRRTTRRTFGAAAAWIHQ
jgi:hypothetical protein